MNLLLIEPDELSADGRVRLAGRRAQHLLKVLGARPGRRLRAGVIGGAFGTAEVEEAVGGAVSLRFEAEEDPVPVAPPIDLVLALPRPKALRRSLRLIATMGVRRLDLVNAWRVEKSFFDSPVLDPEAIRGELVLGAEQGGTTRLPEVAVHRLLMPFLRGLERDRPERARLLAHPGAAEAIERALAKEGAAGPTEAGALLAMGPEGGWIEKELASFEALGFVPVSLGPWVLTSEVAVAVALGQIEVVTRSRADRAGPPQAESASS